MPREDVLAPGISLGLNLRFLICGIRKMSARGVGSWLILLGLTGAITSIVWWQNFYNQVMGHACLRPEQNQCQTNPAKLLVRLIDAARRIAANIAKLPELLKARQATGRPL
jgi:hypothetical protein